MRRAVRSELAPGHYVRISQPGGGTGWGEVQRLQDNMVLVRSSEEDGGGGAAVWFPRGQIREYYEKVGADECLRVDHHNRVQLRGKDVVMYSEGRATVTGGAELSLQAPTVQLSSTQMNLVANTCAVRAGRLEARCGGAAWALDERGAEIDAPICRVRGDLEVRGLSLMDAIMRIDRDIAALIDRVQTLEGALAAASRPPRSPDPEPAAEPPPSSPAG